VNDRADLVGERIASLRGLIADRGAAALRLDSRRDFAWLTLGGLNHVLLSSEQGVAPVIVTANEAVVLAPVNEQERIVDEELNGLPIRTQSLPWWDETAAEREARTIAGEGKVLTANDLAGELEAVRSQLTPFEHDRMREIAGIVVEALDFGLDSIGTGYTEDQLSTTIAGHVASVGARLPVILVAADHRIDVYRHPLPTDTPIRRRVMVVVVVEKWGLHVAATRFRELKPPSSEVRARATAVDEVLARMNAATVVGNTFDDVLAAARAAYTEQGMAHEWELHHQGGSIGYAGRERIARPGDSTPIRAGMAFAWNPSAVGCKAETTLLLAPDGAQEILT
jgi:Xaa-Pro aminopeptidase